MNWELKNPVINKKNQTSSSYDTDYIASVLYDNIEDVLEHFNIEYTKAGNKLVMPCPVHGGDNPNGFSILLQGVGNWRCYTHQCHEQHGSPRGASLIKLVQCLLSDNKQVSFGETLRWLKSYLKLSDEHLVEASIDSMQRSFINLTKFLSNKETKDNHFIPKDIAIQNLKIPSEYYLKRGFEKTTLEYFCVGDCHNPSKQMYNRAIVPFFDESGKYMVGCSGRSLFDKCIKCSTYHNPQHRCPIDKKEMVNCSKWKHMSGFNAENYYYGLWNSYKYITTTKTAIIVESPGNLWKLYEAGINNTVAALGTKFTEGQRLILEALGVMNIIVAPDNDEAGHKMAKNIVDNYNRFFNILVVDTPHEDFGETPITVIQDLFRGLI